MQENTRKLKNKLVFSSMMFLIGLMFLVRGFFMEYRIETAIPLEKLNKTNCHKGEYVYGSLEDYVVIENEYIGKTASMQEITEGFKNYGVSLIRLNSDDYMQFLYSNNEYKKKLYTIKQEKIEPIYIEGKITTNNYDEFDSELYEQAILPEDYSKEKVFTKYVVKDVEFSESKDWMCLGMIVVVLSVGLFNFVTRRVNKVSDYTYKFVENEKVYNIENFIKVQRDYIEKYEKELDELYRKARMSVIFVCISLIMEVFSFYDEIIWIGAIAGVFVFRISIGRVYEYGLNSGKVFFERWMERTGNISICTEIENKKRLIMTTQSLDDNN